MSLRDTILPMIAGLTLASLAVWELFLGILLLVAIPALEFYVWHTAIWWHSDTPKDPRNGL
jgi:hypothetical protein